MYDQLFKIEFINENNMATVHIRKDFHREQIAITFLAKRSISLSAVDEKNIIASLNNLIRSEE